MRLNRTNARPHATHTHLSDRQTDRQHTSAEEDGLNRADTEGNGTQSIDRGRQQAKQSGTEYALDAGHDGQDTHSHITLLAHAH